MSANTTIANSGKNNNIIPLGLASYMVIALNTAVCAQENSSSGSSYTGNILLEEILVTAQKKSQAEAAQSVPIAISAMSGDQIEATFATNLHDIGLALPNVRFQTVGSFPGISNYTIRGMGPLSSVASDEPTVGTFIDGMYIGANFGSNHDTFDLESIEVLRGPQGTLFGRNVTGGAVSMRSKRPSGEFGAKIKAELGSGERSGLALGIENSLGDNLAGKVFISQKDREGDFDNTEGGKLGAETTRFFRPTLEWNATDSLNLTFIGEHGTTTGDGATSRLINNPNNFIGASGYVASDDETTLSHNFPSEVDIQWRQFIVQADWKLGSGMLTSITGYRDVSFFSNADTDSTPAEIVTIVGVWFDQDQLSQELRYAGDLMDGSIEYTVGAYYFEQDFTQREKRHLFGNPFSITDGSIEQYSYAIFSQFDIELTERLNATLGLRYTSETKDAIIASGDQCDPDFNCVFSFDDEETWSNVGPKIGLSWTASDTTLLYASWTKGFRSGGYNTRNSNSVTASPGPYDEETVTALEIGIKSDFPDGNGRINAALFHNTYDDLQRAVLDPVTLGQSLRNAASATISGVEIELLYLPIETLALTASIGYLDASIDEFNGLDVNGDGAPDPELAKDLELTRAPELTYSTSISYDLILERLGYITFRGSYSYTDKRPINDVNSFFLDEYELVDASVSWTTGPQERLKVSLYGKNLTNEIYANTGSDISLFTIAYQGLPKHYGLNVTYEF